MAASLQQALAARVSSMAEDDRLKMQCTFNVFDKNKNGILERDEVLATLTPPGTGKTMSKEDALAFIALWDSDGNGSFNIDELVTALLIIHCASNAIGCH